MPVSRGYESGLEAYLAEEAGKAEVRHSAMRMVEDTQAEFDKLQRFLFAAAIEAYDFDSALSLEQFFVQGNGEPELIERGWVPDEILEFIFYEGPDEIKLISAVPSSDPEVSEMVPGEVLWGSDPDRIDIEELRKNLVIPGKADLEDLDWLSTGPVLAENKVLKAKAELAGIADLSEATITPAVSKGRLMINVASQGVVTSVPAAHIH